MPRAVRPIRAGVVAVAVLLAALVAAGGLVSIPSGPGGRTGPAAPWTSGPRSSPALALSSPEVPSTGPVGSAGSTVETLLPNYNGSLAGNFPSTVDDWQVGSPAFVPVPGSLGTLWLPEFPTSAHGPDSPVGAPAVVYNLTSNSFEGFVPSLSNASAFVYDSGNGNLYACDPATNSVEVFDPATRTVVDPAIPVGTHPDAIAYDPENQYLFVANAGSNNVTVINGHNQQLVASGVSVGATPVAIAVDPLDERVFVANANTSSVSILNATNPTQSISPVIIADPAASLGYSSLADTIAVAIPSYDKMPLMNPAGFIGSLPMVGFGARIVVASSDQATFVVVNQSGSHLSFLNATTGSVVSQNLSVTLDPTELVPVPTSLDVIVWSGASRNLTTINIETRATTARSATLGPQPNILAVDSDIDRLFVSDPEMVSIEILNATSGHSLAAPIPLAAPPLSLGVDAAAEEVFVGVSNSVAVYDALTSHELYGNALLPGSNGPLVVDPASGMLWDARPGKVAGLNITTLQPVVNATGLTVDPAYPQSMVLDPVTDSVFAINWTSGKVIVFSASSGTTIGSPISAGANLTSLAYDGADGMVYAAGDQLTAIDPVGLTTLGTPLPLPPHTGPAALAFDPSTAVVYVAYSSPGNGTGTVIAVDGSSVLGLSGPSVRIPDGLGPVDLAIYAPVDPNLNGSDFVLSANSLSGTVGLIGAPPAISSFAFEPPNVDVGQSSHAMVDASGGVGPSVLSFAGLPAGCSSSNAVNLTCTPTGNGSVSVEVTVTDSIGESATATASLNVGPAIRLSAQFGPLAPPEIDVNLPFAVSAGASGGTPPYNFSWNFGDGVTGFGPELTHEFGSPGSFPVIVSVTDSAGGLALESASVRVYPAPSVAPYGVPGLSTDVNLPLDLFGNVSGGAPPGIGSWSLGGGGTASGVNVTPSWTAPGQYTVQFNYTDSAGGSATAAPISVNVAPDLSGTFTALPTTSSPVPGTPYNFTAIVQDGTPPYIIAWSFGNGLSAVGPRVSTSFPTSGEFSVAVTVVDAAGGVLSTTVDVQVPSPAKGSPSVLGGNFGSGITLGLFLGAAVAAGLMFLAERSRRRTLPSPPSPYVPPPSPPGSSKRN